MEEIKEKEIDEERILRDSNMYKFHFADNNSDDSKLL
jgi:hypothetical protein